MITNILTVPLLLLIWSLDSMLFLVVLRLVVSRMAPDARLKRSLHDLTDPIFRFAEGAVHARFTQPMRDWQVRAIAVAGLVLARYILVAVVLVMS